MAGRVLAVGGRRVRVAHTTPEFLASSLTPFPMTASSTAAPRTTYRPVVLMHGLGDAGSNPGMQSLAQSVMAKYPGSYAVRP